MFFEAGEDRFAFFIRKISPLKPPPSAFGEYATNAHQTRTRRATNTHQSRVPRTLAESPRDGVSNDTSFSSYARAARQPIFFDENACDLQL